MYSFAMRSLMKAQFRYGVVAGMRRLYHHEEIIAYIFRALAAGTRSPVDRLRYLELARLSDRKARHAALQLSLLRPAKVPGDETYRETTWRKALLRSTPNRAMQWMAWMERMDHRQLNSLLNALAAWR
jgi:hypothetical protein